MLANGPDAWLSEMPTWGIALLLFVSITAAVAAGHRWLPKKAQGDDKDDDQEGFLVTAVTGLLALLLGFTFSLAVDRFETRRVLVLEEANAIGTAYLRTQLLEEPHRARISDLLKRYVDLRIELSAEGAERDIAKVASNDALMNDLWREVMAAFPTIRGFDFSSSYLDSINAVIDLNTSRKVARVARVPGEIFVVLFIYIVAAAGVLGGYVLKGRRGRFTGIVLFALFSLSLLLIIDIDRPAGGGIKASQLPMILLKESLGTDYSMPAGP